MESRYPHERIFLDTNVYIVGATDLSSSEGKILRWLGFEDANPTAPEVILSQDVIRQILRVGKRLQGKDWAGRLIAQVWQNFRISYVLFDQQSVSRPDVEAVIPREDVSVFLTAKQGNANDFISSNHELIRVMVRETKDFKCWKPDEFVSHYLSDMD
jgi:predicted nucleic acid-binding protein